MSIPPNLKLSKTFFKLDELRKDWGWFLLFGLVLIALGVFAVASSTAVTLASMVVLGVLLLIGGIMQTIYAFWMREWSGFFLSLLSGIIYTVLGLMLTIHPTAGALSLTLLLAAFYIIGGIFRMITSAYMRFEMWGWAFFSGLIKFVLGMLIWVGWPQTGLWVFGLFIGIDLIFYGWFWAILAISARNYKPLEHK